MAGRGVRGLVLALVTTAAALGVVLVAVATVAARGLAGRADEVRRGVLADLSHELETTLRDTGPDEVETSLAAFCGKHDQELVGAVLLGPTGELGRCGVATGEAIETPLALGPAWRGRVVGGGPGHGGGRGPGGRLRLYPAAALGSAGALPSLVLGGATVAALALVGLAVVAARGVLQREHLAAVEAERERLEGLALAGAGLAHRVRNPLAAIKGTAQLLAEQLGEPARGRAGRILEATERIELLLSRLLTFARPPEPHPERLDLGAVAEAVVARCPRPAVLRTSGSTWVRADRDHIESILEELLANARAFDPDGEIIVEVSGEAAFVSLTVLDGGPGPQVASDRAFEPWVTSRPDGTGLGLAIVRALAHAGGGRVSLTARRGGGTAARLELPAVGA